MMRHPRELLDRPLVWGLGYLMLVPFFALLYAAMPASFTQSTLLREPSTLRRDTQRFEHALAEVAKSAVSRTTDVSDIDFDLRLDGNIAELGVTWSGGEGGGSWFTAKFSYDDYGVERHFTLRPLEPEEESTMREFALAFADAVPLDTYAVAAYHDTPQVMIWATPRLLSLYMGLIAAREGDPTAASNAYLRMLYFSAMTITSVGYGDIVPTSEPARLAVTAEAVMGVVFIGLFLNAVGRRSARGERTERHSVTRE